MSQLNLFKYEKQVNFADIQRLPLRERFEKFKQFFIDPLSGIDSVEYTGKFIKITINKEITFIKKTTLRNVFGAELILIE